MYLRCNGETGVWVGGAEKGLGLAAAVAAGISELVRATDGDAGLDVKHVLNPPPES